MSSMAERRYRIAGATLILMVVFALLLPGLTSAKVECSDTKEQQTQPGGGTVSQAPGLRFAAGAALAEGTQKGVNTTLNSCTCKEVDEKGKTIKEFGLSCLIKVVSVQSRAPGSPFAAAVGVPTAPKVKVKVLPECRPDRTVPKGVCKTTEDEAGKKKALGDLSINDFNDAVNKRRVEVGDLITAAKVDGAIGSNQISLLPESQGVGDAYKEITSTYASARPGTSLTGAKTGADAGAVAGKGTRGVDAGRAIGGIAQGSYQTGPLGGSQGGSSRGSGRTFSTSPFLSNIANWVTGGGGGGGGGGGYSGGTVAYGPQGDPGFYNRNFESADSQITFPQAQPSPEQIIAYLAQNTKRQQGDKVTAEELKERGVVENVVLQAINNVVTPVGDFMRAVFAGEETSPPSGEEVSAAAKEKKPPLERGRLVLTLSADDSLVPGDPTVLEPPERPTYEAFESIPESNRAWVQSAPRAGEKIEGIASAPPTYGWGEASQGEAEGGVREVGSPQISDVSYEPFLPFDGFVPDAGEEEGTAEPPRSFFSVMGKSFGTITDAVSSLFTNIGKSLLWWL